MIFTEKTEVNDGLLWSSQYNFIKHKVFKIREKKTLVDK